MTIIVKVEPTVRAGDHTSHFVAVFHFDGKNFVDSGKRLHVGVNGVPNQVGEEPLYSEGRAVLLVEGWGDGSTESGERCPDIIPIIDRFNAQPTEPPEVVTEDELLKAAGANMHKLHKDEDERGKEQAVYNLIAYMEANGLRIVKDKA